MEFRRCHTKVQLSHFKAQSSVQIKSDFITETEADETITKIKLFYLILVADAFTCWFSGQGFLVGKVQSFSATLDDKTHDV